MSQTLPQLSDNTQQKVNRNLAGLQYLMNRVDTKDIRPQTDMLNACKFSPAFSSCRAIMRDGLNVICISLRVPVTTLTKSSEQHTHYDIIGRGTTFEMALFELSAKLIKKIEENDFIDTDYLPVLTQGGAHVREKSKEPDAENPVESIRANESASVADGFDASQQDVGKGLAARSDNRRRNRRDAKRYSKRGGKAANGRGGGRSSERSC